MWFLFLIASSWRMNQSTFNTIIDKTIRNKTKGSYIKSQLAGHFTLGSSSSRNQIQKPQIASLQLPYINADCGGIDIFMGGFNFINEQAFIDLLKNIGSSAKSYAFNLALETVSPQIASVIKFLQSVAQEINASSINSCEAASALLGAVAPRNTKLQEHTCKLMSSNKGRLTDYMTSRKGCNEGGNARNRTAEEMNTNNPNTMHEEFNVAWEVISKNAWG